MKDLEQEKPRRSRALSDLTLDKLILQEAAIFSSPQKNGVILVRLQDSTRLSIALF